MSTDLLKNHLMVTPAVGKRTKEGCDCGSEDGTAHCGKELDPLEKQRT